MKKFAFSLQKVLDFKTQTHDILMGELANLTHELSLIEEKIAELNDLHTIKNDEMYAELAKGVTAASIASFKVFLGSITAQIRRKELEKIEQQKLIEKKQAQIIAAKVEIASMEKLKEKQQQEYSVLETKAHEIELNEFISNLQAENNSL